MTGEAQRCCLHGIFPHVQRANRQLPGGSDAVGVFRDDVFQRVVSAPQKVSSASSSCSAVAVACPQ